EHVTTTSNDLLLSGEDRLKLTELIELCIQLQSRVFALETKKANQALEIRSLKRRVKKLKKKVNKKTHKLKRLYKICSSTRVESSEDACLADQEDASKQRRMIEDLDVDERVALVDETQGRNDQDMFDTSIFDDEEVVAQKEISTADLVPTPGEIVATAGVEVSTTTAGEVVTTVGVEAKRIVRQEPSETPTPTPIDSSQQLSKAKDKGKAKMIEPKKPFKRKEQIMIDEEDNTQAMMDADCELAARLQEEDRGELSIEEKLKLFVELMDKRKKYFAKLRAEKIRSKPPTKAQKRNQMCTYLKNMENYKHNQLKNKIFKEIQMLFNNTMKWIDSFVPMDIELVKGSEKAVEGSEKDEECSSKRPASNLEQEDTKRQRIKEENESAELKRCLEIIPDDDDVTIEATPLSSKSPTIVNYKIYKERRKSFFKIIRVDGNSQNHLTFEKMFKNFNREDLEVLWSIIKARFKKTKPVDDMDNLLFQTLKTMFEHHVEDNI
nr:hypothetical protein [Tanacetum cinerariifolium]